ncbi:MAG: DUF4229 domain-containing protein [Mycobacteriaceae bacterium]|nr:DUF4229 domain-containing protein [Mycobacteriaceae bacterium]
MAAFAGGPRGHPDCRPGRWPAPLSWPSVSEPTSGRGLARDVVLYTAARLALVAALAALIVGVGRLVSVQVPLLVALLFALIIALPLAMVLFKGLRARVSGGIATVDERRRADRDQLRARLRGDAQADRDEP